MKAAQKSTAAGRQALRNRAAARKIAGSVTLTVTQAGKTSMHRTGALRSDDLLLAYLKHLRKERHQRKGGAA